MATELITGKLVGERMRPAIAFCLKPNEVRQAVEQTKSVAPALGRVVAELLQIEHLPPRRGRATAQHMIDTL